MNGKPIFDMATTLPRIDTHGHILTKFPSLRDRAKSYAPMNCSTHMMYSRIAAAGCRELFGIDPGACLGPDAPEELFRKSEEFYGDDHAAAFEKALNHCHIDQMLVFCDFNAAQSGMMRFSPRFRQLAYFDNIVAANHEAWTPERIDEHFERLWYQKLCGRLGNLATLDDLLGKIDEIIDGWRDAGVVGMKMSFAYTTGLHFGDPTIVEARRAFDRKEIITREEYMVVRDYAFRHALLACLRNHLPVVIHTGFQIYGRASLDVANPMLLHNLLLDARYRDLTFVLLHGGNPYVGETTYLASQFPNVVIDFTWISWMTPTRFRFALAEWLEIVPHDKMIWGADCFTPEDLVGIDYETRRNIAEVLDDQIRRGVLDEKAAAKFLENCYQNTPKRVFGI